MKDNKVVYEIKLEKSVKVILGAFALGIMLNAVSPDFPIKEALAELSNGAQLNIHHSGSIMKGVHHTLN
jgi:hypothetical protein